MFCPSRAVCLRSVATASCHACCRRFIRRFHTPHNAIVIYGVVVGAIALSGTYETLTVFANLAALMLYFLCAIAAYVLRKRDVRTDGEPFLAPGGPLVPIAACLSLAWLFYETVEPAAIHRVADRAGLCSLLYVLRAWRLKAQAP